MIQAVFQYVEQKGYCGMEISGHAGFAEHGKDIVCAAVTSAMLLTINGITEIVGVPAKADVEENKVSFCLPIECPFSAREFIAAFRLHLELLANDYPNTINITIMEV